MILIPYEPWHYHCLFPETVLEGRKSRAYAYAKFPAFTGVLNGTILGCAGIGRWWKGVGEAWLATSREGRTHRMWARQVKRILPELMKLSGYHRVQCHAAEDFPEAIRFIEWLGFKFEGRCEKFGPDGQNMLRYVIFPKLLEVSDG